MFHELDRGGKCKSRIRSAPATPVLVSRRSFIPARIDPEHSRDRHQLVVNSNQRSRQRHDKPGAW